MGSINFSPTGRIVTALTYRDADRDLPPKRVQGELLERFVKSLGYKQYIVDGVLIDPNTVEDVARR